MHACVWQGTTAAVVQHLTGDIMHQGQDSRQSTCEASGLGRCGDRGGGWYRGPGVGEVDGAGLLEASLEASSSTAEHGGQCMAVDVLNWLLPLCDLTWL